MSAFKEAHMVKAFPSKCEALSSNPNTTEEKRGGK
jgi:hypothetical protein